MTIAARPSKLPDGFKLTDAGWIPQDWDVSTVSAEFTIQLGKMIDAAKNTGVLKPYVGNRAVQWGHVDLDAIATVPLSRSDLQRFRLQRGDLLVCEGGEIGRAAIWDDPIPECYYQKAIHRLRAKQGYDAFLMMSFLQLWAWTGHLCNYVTQTSIAHLPKEKFEIVPLPVPPPPEQQVIAEALSDVDGLIGALEKLIAKKRAIKQAAMQQLLTGKTRLPGFTNSTAVQKTEIGILPADWSLRPLGSEIEALEAGVSVRSVDTPQDMNSEGPAVLKTSAVEDGHFLPGECKPIDSRDKSRAKLNPRADTILISRMNTIALVGECGYVDRDYSNLFIPDRLWMTRFRSKGSISARWLSYVLTTRDYGQKLKAIATGTSGSMKNIAKPSLLGLLFAFPEPEEQRAIAAVLSEMDAEIEALEHRRDKTKQIKQGMMQQLLTGRIRLVEPQTLVAQPEAATGKAKSRNRAFNDAVVISVLAKQFGSEAYPLGRMRYQKLSYLLHRHAEGQVEGYLKKAAGPYNPNTRYGGSEKIALENGYVREHQSGEYHGFVAADNIAEAEAYFDKRYGSQCVRWLEQFRRKRNDDLELLATVDMAAEELRAVGKSVDVAGVKEVLRGSADWKPKLDRPVFSDASIAKAIETCRKLFN